jgi:hypothetical protein
MRQGGPLHRAESLEAAWRRKKLAELADGGGQVIPFTRPRPAATVSKLVVPRPEPEPVIAHFPPEISDRIKARPVTYLGRRCELAGFGPDCWGGIEAHHRVGKGMGGCTDPALHVAANGLAVCAVHHAWVHHNVEQCRPLGLILLRGTDFYTWPVSFDGGNTRHWLNDDGWYVYSNPLGGDAA